MKFPTIQENIAMWYSGAGNICSTNPALPTNHAIARNQNERVEEREQRGAADEQQELQEGARPDGSPQLHGVAEVHQRRLEVALVPARALLDPVHEVAVRFLVRLRVEHGGAHAHAVESDPEIRVLGHVVRIPCTDRLEHVALDVVRRAPERDRRVPRRQTGQEQREPHQVLDREPTGDDVLIGVVERQLGLEADDIRRQPAERRHGSAKLEWVGVILGIEDRDELAARELEPETQRPRLGARLARGNEHDLDMVGDVGGHRRGDRLLVVGLEEQLHVEAVLGVVELPQSGEQRRDDARLPVGRNEHRVDGKISVGDRARLRVGHDDRLGMPRRTARDHDAVDDGREVGHGRDRHQRDERRERRDHQGEEDDQLGADEREPLASVEDDRRRELGQELSVLPVLGGRPRVGARASLRLLREDEPHRR